MLKKVSNFKILKKKLILNYFDFNSLNNFKKLFFFINKLKKKKLKILLIGDSNIYNIISSLFYFKKKNNIFKFKNIVFYKDKWIPGSITSKKLFFKKIKKEKVNLIIILKYNPIMFSQLNELIKLNLPLIFFSNYNHLVYYKLKILYNIEYKDTINNSKSILLIYLLKFIFFNEKF